MRLQLSKYYCGSYHHLWERCKNRCNIQCVSNIALILNTSVHAYPVAKPLQPHLGTAPTALFYFFIVVIFLESNIVIAFYVVQPTRTNTHISIYLYTGTNEYPQMYSEMYMNSTGHMQSSYTLNELDLGHRARISRRQFVTSRQVDMVASIYASRGCIWRHGLGCNCVKVLYVEVTDSERGCTSRSRWWF